jgi:hypothetical protein
MVAVGRIHCTHVAPIFDLLFVGIVLEKHLEAIISKFRFFYAPRVYITILLEKLKDISIDLITILRFWRNKRMLTFVNLRLKVPRVVLFPDHHVGYLHIPFAVISINIISMSNIANWDRYSSIRRSVSVYFPLQI